MARHSPTTGCSELRILHRGYTALKFQSQDRVERNMRIAKRALDDPEVDHSRALFDYGRTLAEAGDPRLAIAPLREAADTTEFPIVRRVALRTIFHVHLVLEEFEDASEVLEEMRQGLTRTITADVLNVKLLLVQKHYEACLEAIDRLPFADTDEDGWELGRASVAGAKAQALDALGRPGEAADALLDALRTHGQLDESLATLVDLLRKAGRLLSEIAQKARPESMPVLVAMASRLPAPEADEVLASFAEVYPERLEPLAAARDVRGPTRACQERCGGRTASAVPGSSRCAPSCESFGTSRSSPPSSCSRPPEGICPSGTSAWSRRHVRPSRPSAKKTASARLIR